MQDHIQVLCLSTAITDMHVMSNVPQIGEDTEDMPKMGKVPQRAKYSQNS